MSGKMTNEALLRDLETLVDDKRHSSVFRASERIRAHIAALTAERDGAVSNCAACAENVSLRELVKALEAENARLAEHVKATLGGPFGPEVILLRGGRNLTEWEKHAKSLESRLAAISQRAGDEVSLIRSAEVGAIMGAASTAWDEDIHDEVVQRGDADTLRGGALAVARYIVGEDAPAHDALVLPSGAALSVPPGFRPETVEPTTAESFATVRAEWREAYNTTGEPGAERFAAALSLLERRMGAMGAALRAVIAAYDDKRAMGAPIRQARAALTGAPPVSPVPTELAALIDGFAGEVRRAEEHHASIGKGGMLVPFHGDFASAPPSTLGRLRWWADALKGGRTSAPVFTLEDVCKVMERTAIHAPAQRDVVAALTALRGMQ